jgi:hypothetical protein
MELATLSVRSRRTNLVAQALSADAARLPVLLSEAPAELRDALESELAAGALADSFYALPASAVTRGPFVRIQRASELDGDVEVSAQVGGSEAARHAVFQLVQTLLARSPRVRVCFLAQDARTSKARP